MCTPRRRSHSFEQRLDDAWWQPCLRSLPLRRGRRQCSLCTQRCMARLPKSISQHQFWRVCRHSLQCRCVAAAPVVPMLQYDDWWLLPVPTSSLPHCVVHLHKFNSSRIGALNMHVRGGRSSFLLATLLAAGAAHQSLLTMTVRVCTVANSASSSTSPLQLTLQGRGGGLPTVAGVAGLQRCGARTAGAMRNGHTHLLYYKHANKPQQRICICLCRTLAAYCPCC